MRPRTLLDHRAIAAGAALVTTAAAALVPRFADAQEAQATPTVTTAATTAARSNAPVTTGSPPTSTVFGPPPQGQSASQAKSGRVLTLAVVERAAVEQQPQMRVARAQTGVAEATADVAFAPLLPQVIGTAEYLHEWGNARTSGIPVATAGSGGTSQGASATTGSSLVNQFNVFSFGVTGTQLIYDFGQTTGRYHAASATVEAQRYNEASTRLQIVANVRRAYFAARANKDLVDVAEEALETQRKHVVQTQGFVTVGTQPPIALVQQKASLATFQVQLITSQNNYETAKAQLNQAAGIVGGTDYDVSDETIDALDDEEKPLDDLVQKALQGRPELANLAKQQAAGEATVRSVKGGYGPTLSGTAGASEAGIALDALGPNINVGLLLTWPLFQGGLTVGQVRQAEANLTSIDAERALEELQVRLDVNTAQLAVRAAKATTGAVNDALDNAKEQQRLSEQRYTTGVGNFVELNDAQLSYATAAAQVVTAKYQLASARAQLLAALGRI